jgi:hypothetical protein
VSDDGKNFVDFFGYSGTFSVRGTKKLTDVVKEIVSPVPRNVGTQAVDDAKRLLETEAAK